MVARPKRLIHILWLFLFLFLRHKPVQTPREDAIGDTAPKDIETVGNPEDLAFGVNRPDIQLFSHDQCEVVAVIIEQIVSVALS